MKVSNPERAFAVLEMTLQGSTLEQCGRAFGVGVERARQLANMAVRLLRNKPYARGPIPKHDWYLAKERLEHREFWLRQIAAARRRLKRKGSYMRKKASS